MRPVNRRAESAGSVIGGQHSAVWGGGQTGEGKRTGEESRRSIPGASAKGVSVNLLAFQGAGRKNAKTHTGRREVPLPPRFRGLIWARCLLAACRTHGVWPPTE